MVQVLYSSLSVIGACISIVKWLWQLFVYFAQHFILCGYYLRVTTGLRKCGSQSCKLWSYGYLQKHFIVLK